MSEILLIKSLKIFEILPNYASQKFFSNPKYLKISKKSKIYQKYFLRNIIFLKFIESLKI